MSKPIAMIDVAFKTNSDNVPNQGILWYNDPCNTLVLFVQKFCR